MQKSNKNRLLLSRDFFWNLYARFYTALPRYFDEYRELKEEVIGELYRCHKQGERVLDAGCGTGSYAISLASEGYFVTGIDFSPTMLSFAAENGKHTRECLRLIQADMEQPLPFNDKFDAILSINVLYALEAPQVALTHLCAHLRPGGTLFLVVPCSAIKMSTIARKIAREKGIFHLLRTGACLSGVVLLNLIIGRKYKRKSYHLWTEQTLLRDLDDNGLETVKISKAYMDTDLFAVAVKR